MADYQSIGVRCRESLLTFINIAQTVIPWTTTENPPKKADLKAWSDHICSVALPGDTHKYRRSLFKTLLETVWEFANWLTHTKSSNWYDAEAAISVTENAIGLSISAVIRHVRGVPEHCPSCGSQRLSPERGYHTDFPDIEWERPTCDKCGWTGEPVPIDATPEPRGKESRPPEGYALFRAFRCVGLSVRTKKRVRAGEKAIVGRVAVFHGRRSPRVIAAILLRTRISPHITSRT